MSEFALTIAIPGSVCLITDHGAPALYQKFGFQFTAPVSVGMAIRL